MMVTNYVASRRRLGTLLAALRQWQRLGSAQARSPEFNIATDDGELEPLNVAEIDALCEELNLKPPSVLQSAPAALTQAETITSVMLQSVVDDCESLADVPEWSWVEAHASYAHRHNGCDGVWEFILNLAKPMRDAPSRLATVMQLARESGAAYLLIRHEA